MKKLLIIGAGGIANAHVTAIKKIRGVRIASLCDIHRERAERFASSHNLKADIFTRPEEAIHGGGHDYALVLTPADTRLPIVRECAAAGLPVYMEKPPCSSIDDGEEMLRMIEEANVVHGVGFMSRYNESLNKTLDRIRQEKLSVIAITFLAPFAHHSIVEKYPYPFDVSRSGGLVGDQGIHYVDVCRYIAQSEVKSVRAVGTNQTLRRSDKVTTCDAACWSFEMENGILVSHSHTWNAEKWECRINIVTDKSDVGIDMFGNTARGRLSGSSYEYTGDQSDPQGFEAENRAFLNAVVQRDMSPVRSTFADAMKSFRVVQEVNRLIYNKDKE